MTDYHWTDIRADLVKAFGGEQPRAADEQAIIETFQRYPTTVIAAAQPIAVGKQAGRIHTAWAVLRSQLQNLSQAHDVTATDETDHQNAQRRAEQWLRTAGLHYDRQSEVEDELYTNPRLLKAFPNDPQLHQRLLALWNELRPRGEQLDQEELNRAESWKQTHKAAGRLP